MSSGGSNTIMSGHVLFIRFVLLSLISVVADLLTLFVWGLNPQQSISVIVFLVIILSTLFFWDFRLAIDLFCNNSKNEFPVVDDDGNLVGVVSEEELI